MRTARSATFSGSGTPIRLARCMETSTAALTKLHDGASGEVARDLQRLGRFPVSGYTTAVDWAASAILEFMYFDLILTRGLDPAAAAQQVRELLSFAGDAGNPDVGFRGTGFRFLPPMGP